MSLHCRLLVLLFLLRRRSSNKPYATLTQRTCTRVDVRGRARTCELDLCMMLRDFFAATSRSIAQYLPA